MNDKEEQFKILGYLKNKLALNDTFCINSLFYNGNFEAFEKDVLVYARFFFENFVVQNRKEDIVYPMKEILSNADKANSKRIYFKDNKIDMEDELEYNRGMVDFKNQYHSKNEYYRLEQYKQGYFVKVDFIILEDSFVFLVSNSAVINKFEKEKLEKRLAILNSDQRGYEKLIASGESAGLGIVLTFLSFKKIVNFKCPPFMFNNEFATYFCICLPKENQEYFQKIKDEFKTLVLKRMASFNFFNDLSDLKYDFSISKADFMFNCFQNPTVAFKVISNMYSKNKAEELKFLSKVDKKEIQNLFMSFQKNVSDLILSESFHTIKTDVELKDFFIIAYAKAILSFSLSQKFLKDKDDNDHINAFFSSIIRDAILIYALFTKDKEIQNIIRENINLNIKNNIILSQDFLKEIVEAALKEYKMPEKIEKEIIDSFDMEMMQHEEIRIADLIYISDFIFMEGKRFMYVKENKHNRILNKAGIKLLRDVKNYKNFIETNLNSIEKKIKFIIFGEEGDFV